MLQYKLVCQKGPAYQITLFAPRRKTILRIVVFSDSHRNYRILHTIVNTHPTADWFVHLGDGLDELELLRQNHPDKAFRGVRGNNDWGSSLPVSDILWCDGKKVFLTHGHTLGVKLQLDALQLQARSVGAHIALFGHTHMPCQNYEDKLYLLNPGSVTLPATGRPSYGLVDITPAGIVTNVAYL